MWLATIEYNESRLQAIIDADFANDQSTHDIKEKAQPMISEIQNLKSKLPK